MDDLKHTYKSLGDAELQFGVSDEEILFAELFKQEELFLGYYSEDGLGIAMERYGIKDDLKALGFEDTHLITSPHSNGYQLQIKNKDTVLVDVVLDIATLNLSETLRIQADSATHRVLYVHWLEMRNPLKEFSSEQPPLPAQNFPGLGLGNKVYEILENVCRRLNLQAIVAVPMYFHNAVFYSKWFTYADPKYQGYFEAIKRDAKHTYDIETDSSSWRRVSTTSWSFVLEPPIEVTSKTKFGWFTEPIMAPISEALQSFTRSDWYAQHTNISKELASYTFPQDTLFEKLKSRGVRPYKKEVFNGI